MRKTLRLVVLVEKYNPVDKNKVLIGGPVVCEGYYVPKNAKGKDADELRKKNKEDFFEADVGFG